MLIAVIALAAFGLLVWIGRRPLSLENPTRLLMALASAAAAAGAVVSGLRGVWLGTLVLVGLSVWLGGQARAGSTRSGQGGGSQNGDAISRRQAAQILGVEADASRAEIEAAYRRLMQRAHPDHGGTAGLAAQLNAARDRLVKRG